MQRPIYAQELCLNGLLMQPTYKYSRALLWAHEVIGSKPMITNGRHNSFNGEGLLESDLNP